MAKRWTVASTRDKCYLAAAPPLRLLVVRPKQVLVGHVASLVMAATADTDLDAVGSTIDSKCAQSAPKRGSTKVGGGGRI